MNDEKIMVGVYYGPNGERLIGGVSVWLSCFSLRCMSLRC